MRPPPVGERNETDVAFPLYLPTSLPPSTLDPRRNPLTPFPPKLGRGPQAHCSDVDLPSLSGVDPVGKLPILKDQKWGETLPKFTKIYPTDGQRRQTQKPLSHGTSTKARCPKRRKSNTSSSKGRLCRKESKCPQSLYYFMYKIAMPQTPRLRSILFYILNYRIK